MQESKDKVMPSKTIVVKAETYQALDALKIVPRDPFDCVIKRLLDQKKESALLKQVQNLQPSPGSLMPTKILAPDQPTLMPIPPVEQKNADA
jgi:hypothetical protein